MTKSEYDIELALAIESSGVPRQGYKVRGEDIAAVAQHLKTDTLKAIVHRRIVYDDDGPLKGCIPFHFIWIQACDNELSDRILTQNLNDSE
jgi:hypothetical protein